MRSPYDIKEKVLLLVFVICLLCPGALCADPNDTFTKRLMRIRIEGQSGLVDGAILEARCLQLLPDHNTPSEKGPIYATVVRIYSERGFGKVADRRTSIAKTKEYAAKALECPLDVLTTCDMYGRLTDAIIIDGMEGPADKWSEVRRAAIVPCLKGLKLALDNKAPKERPEPPPAIVVPNIITPATGNSHQEARRKYEEQLATRKRYDHLESLYVQRWAMMHRCKTLYSRQPDDPNEFRAYARKMLTGHDEALNDVIRLVTGPDQPLPEGRRQ